jgi:hypothetical protein
MQPEMPCALTTKMEPQHSLRQRSLVLKRPLDRPVAAIHHRGHRQVAAAATAIRNHGHQQAAAAALRHPDPLLAPVHPLRPLSRLLRVMAIVRRLSKPSGQKPIKDPQRQT